MAMTAPSSSDPGIVFPSAGHPAGPATQVLALLTAGVALGASVVVAHVPVPLAVGLFFALVAGVACGQIFDLRSWSQRVPGLVGSLVVLVALGIVLLVAFSRTPSIAVLAPVAALVVLGLDWYWAERLRLLVWLTAPVMLILAGSDPPASVAFGALWLVAALGAHGSAERDISRGDELPGVWGAPTTGHEPPARSLVGSILVGVVIGVAVALLLNLALLERRPSADQSASGSGGRRGGGSSNGQVQRDLDGDGRVDRGDGLPSDTLSDSGGRSGSGGQPGEGGSSTGTCEQARGCIATPGDGRIVVDDSGRPIIDTDHDGNLDVHRDGRLGIDLNSDGRIDSYATDRIIVDADGDGRIAIDSDGDGIADRTEAGSVGLDSNGDGVIDRNGTGRVGVDVDGDGRLDSTDPGWLVVPDGSPAIPQAPGTLGTDADPDVVIADGVDPNVPTTRAPSPSTTPPTTVAPKQDGDGSPWPWLIGLAVAVLAGLLGAWLYHRFRAGEDDDLEPDPLASKVWARSLLEQLEHEGAARGRSRRAHESVVGYGRALVAGVLPDARILEVVAALDRDLFGPVGLDDHERSATTQLLADAAAAYPPGWEADRDDLVGSAVR